MMQQMQILLTNDDGIYAPGLAAMERELPRWATWWWLPQPPNRAAWAIRSPI